MTNARQPRASFMEHVMLRRFLVGATILVGLSLGSAAAQTGGFCSKFDSGGIDGWGACASGPNIIVTPTTDSGGITPTDPYLKLTDLSGASSACTTDAKYLGDWNAKMGGCGQFCFDFKVFNSGSPPSAITPSFTIYGPGTSKATFVANFQVLIGDATWHQHICAPIALGASPPPSPNGHWVVSGGTWNSIITAVTMVSLPVDFSSSPSEVVGYDNLCMSPGGCDVTPPPEVTGCLKDMKVAVKCNPDGTYTVTLTGGGFSGNDITLTSQTAGVTVTPPMQPDAPTTTWVVTGATAGQTVVLTATATKIGGGTEPGTDLCCSAEIKIVMPECPKVDVGKLIVEKKVKNNTSASTATINALIFPIGVTCGPPSTLNVSFGLNNGGSHTENNIPYGSLCTVTEAVSTLPPVPKDVCGQGSTAVWSTPVIVPPSATINAPITAFTVVNELNCKKIGQVGSLVVTKKVVDHSPLPIPAQTYPVTVTCGSTVTNLNLVDGVPQTVSNIPLGTSCSVVEGTVTTPPNVCPPRMTPVWSTTYVPPPPVTITTSPTIVTVINALACKQIQPEVCPPPLVPGPVANHCVCPPGTVLKGKECVKPETCAQPMVPSPVAGVCVCPKGTVQQGKRCVPPLKCSSPLISNAAGTDCVCRPGLVQKGRTCVEPVVCNPPAKLNRRGACECPTDMVARGNSCVPRERQQPQITPGDIIRNIPGGGRDNENPRGGRDTDKPGGGGQGSPDFPGRR